MQNHAGNRAPATIQAAGGIVWRGSEPVIAIVHRTAHNDWVLPKGKIEPGESAQAAAIREVREETGYEVSIGEFVGVISYEANGHPKVVRFWHMEAGSQMGAPLRGEVDKVKWLPPTSAIQELKYPLERLLVEEADQNRAVLRRPRGWLMRWQTGSASSTARLRQSITTYRAELERRLQSAADTGASNWHWARSALALLDRAKEAADENDHETGWRCFKAATRTELFGLSTGDDELSIRATHLVAEGRQKLRGWRKEALLQTLLSGEQLKSSLTPQEVASAARLLHENEDNEYRRLSIRRRQFIVLGVLALVLLPIFIALLGWAGLVLDVRDPWGVLQIAVLGGLGAAISGILRIGERQAGARIPEELSGFLTLLARLVVGAAMAVFVVALWQSEFLQLPNAMQTPQFAIALAFVAGFSERFAQNAVERMVSTGAG